MRALFVELHRENLRSDAVDSFVIRIPRQGRARVRADYCSSTSAGIVVVCEYVGLTRRLQCCAEAVSRTAFGLNISIFTVARIGWQDRNVPIRDNAGKIGCKGTRTCRIGAILIVGELERELELL